MGPKVVQDLTSMLSKHNAATCISLFIFEVYTPVRPDITKTYVIHSSDDGNLNLNVLYRQHSHESSCCSELLLVNQENY